MEHGILAGPCLERALDAAFEVTGEADEYQLNLNALYLASSYHICIVLLLNIALISFCIKATRDAISLSVMDIIHWINDTTAYHRTSKPGHSWFKNENLNLKCNLQGKMALFSNFRLCL